MATNFRRKVSELFLRHCTIVETIHAAEQEQRAEKFRSEKVKKSSPMDCHLNVVRSVVILKLILITT